MSPESVQVHLRLVGKTLSAAAGTPLADLLFSQGVEFPCGARGRCRGCRIKVLEGTLPVDEAERRLLSENEIAGGWRMACRHALETDLSLAIAQWESPILSEHLSYAFTPSEGLGVAVDLGTTTVVAQLVDLRDANIPAVRAELNRQSRHGADLMSRIGAALAPGGGEALTSTIRQQVGRMIQDLLRATSGGGLPPIRRVVLAGNTAMHHFFGGLDCEPLSRYPFETGRTEALRWRAPMLLWEHLPEDCEVVLLPCIGGFVGGDVLAGLLAAGFGQRDGPEVFLDLGTNGEIVATDGSRILCASTAAGPAFEGARISMGMRAATGAISDIKVSGNSWECVVLGGGEPRGICGSGLVSAVAAGLDLGRILPGGRLAQGERWTLCPPVSLHQCDIRELQLAKGAIAAGLEMLLGMLDTPLDRVSEVFLAGAFGNYVSVDAARRIGLLRFPGEKTRPMGNTSLLGAKIALHAPDPVEACELLRSRVTHVSLHANPSFQEIYVAGMVFPDPGPQDADGGTTRREERGSRCAE